MGNSLGTGISCLRVCIGLWVALFFGLGIEKEAHAAPQDPIQWIDAARRAYAQQKIDQVYLALQQADKSFSLQKQKYTRPERINIQLWLHLLWSKYYRFQARWPRFQKLSARHRIEEIKEQLQKLQRALEHYQRVVFHLDQYNTIFRSAVLRRSNVREMLMIVNTSRQKEHFLNRIKILQNRISIIRLFVSQKKLHDAAQDLDGTVGEFSKNLHELRSEMTEHAEEIDKMRATYQRASGMERTQHQRKQGLLWGGSIGLVVGAGLLVGGFFCMFEVDRTDAEGLPVHTIHKAREFSDTGFRLMLIGGGVALGGLSVLLVGLFQPSGKAHPRSP